MHRPFLPQLNDPELEEDYGSTLARCAFIRDPLFPAAQKARRPFACIGSLLRIYRIREASCISFVVLKVYQILEFSKFGRNLVPCKG